MRYRWLVSAGGFIGCTASFLVLREILLPARRGGGDGEWLPLSLAGIAVSLIALFHHPSIKDAENLLDHQATPLIAVGLNAWPYFLLAWALFWS